MNQDNFRKLVSGQSAALGAAFLRLLLGFAAVGYSIVVRLRNFIYSNGWLKTHRVSAVVISIGNITTGGTGKTPLVIWLCRFLQNQNLPCAVLTRGYKTHPQKRASSIEYRETSIDEPAVLVESCPEVKMIVNPNRVEAAAEAVNKFGAKVLIMDDGFQHRRLRRDLDIVAIDVTRPFGYGKLLPAGLLREPIASLERADAAVLTRCDQIAEIELTQLEEKLLSVSPNMVVVRSAHTPICVKLQGDKEIGIEQLRSKKIFAFCGIGNPDAFLNTIKQLGTELTGSKIYNDHYHYASRDVAQILEEAGRSKADLILTTQKDWARTTLLKSAKKDIPFAYLVVELKFTAGEDKLRRLIENVLTGRIVSKEL